MKNNNTTFFDFDSNSDKKTNWKTESIINQDMFLEALSKIEELNENNKIKFEIQKVIEVIKNPKKDNLGLLNISSNGDTTKVNKEILLKDLSQIAEAQTVERAKYYISRLKKSLTEIKTSKINDLNLNRWKEYDDILTEVCGSLIKEINLGLTTRVIGVILYRKFLISF